MMTDLEFLTGAVVAFKGKATAACDLPSAFLHTKVEKR